MNYYTITEDKTDYNKTYYKKFNSLKDCKKWIKNNLDNTKNWKVFNGLYYTHIFNDFNYLLEEINQIRIKENYWNSDYIKELMEDYNNE